MGWIDKLFGQDRPSDRTQAPANEPSPNEPGAKEPAPPANGESYTLDELFAPHEAYFAQLALPCVDIEMTAVPEEAHSALEPDGMEARASKLGGVPFSPAGYEWPTDPNGNRLHLLAQVNFAEAPPLSGPNIPKGFPTDGILQVFEHDFGVDSDYEFGEVKYFTAEEARAPHVPYAGDAPLFDPVDAAVSRPCRMSFAPSVSEGGAGDADFQNALTAVGLGALTGYEDDTYDEARDELYDRFSASGHRIGGYAGFTQEDFRVNQEYPDVHVLQIDSDEHVMFGDCGVAHVFIPADALAAGDWSKAHYYWDCS